MKGLYSMAQANPFPSFSDQKAVYAQTSSFFWAKASKDELRPFKKLGIKGNWVNPLAGSHEASLKLHGGGIVQKKSAFSTSHGTIAHTKNWWTSKAILKEVAE